MALKNLGRLALLSLVGAVALWAAVVPAAAAQTSGSYNSGGGYHLGNPMWGDLGGYYGGGGQSIHGDVGLDFGGGLGLGCDGVNIMDYMKAKFNMSEMQDKLKTMMKTFMAKQVLTMMMSIPQVAAAYDFLNGDLNLGFDMFQQSCDIGAIRQKGKQLYIERECGKFPNGGPEYIQCVEGYDAMKPLREQFQKNFGKQLCAFKEDPVQTMRPTLCGKGSTDSSPCILMSYLPEICIESSLCGRSCVGGNMSEPVINMAGVSDAMMEQSHMAGYKASGVWERIRASNPDEEAPFFQAIGERATKLFKEDPTCGVSTAAPAASGDVKTDAMFEQYRSQGKMATCKNKPYLYNAMHMLNCVAKAANEEMSAKGKGGISFNQEDFKVGDGEKIDAAKFFNLPPKGSAAADRLGIDAETGSEMLQETFGCLVNTEIMLTSPVAQAKLATTSTMSWEDYHRAIGQRLSCAAVDYMGRFVLSAVVDAKPRLNGDNLAKNWEVNVSKADGSTAKENIGDIPTEAVKDDAKDILEQIEKRTKQELETNRDMCVRKNQLSEVLKDMFTPRQQYYGRDEPMVDFDTYDYYY